MIPRPEAALKVWFTVRTLFDNTAAFAATANALDVLGRVRAS
jgi:hypothetical protein